MVTVTKSDLISLGYGPSFAADIIKEAKKLMMVFHHQETFCVFLQNEY